MIQAALHLVAATLLALALGRPSPLILVLALVLALLPNLDTPKSLVGRLLQPISVPLERRFGHRTITHSMPALLLVAGAAYPCAPMPTHPSGGGTYPQYGGRLPVRSDANPRQATRRRRRPDAERPTY